MTSGVNFTYILWAAFAPVDLRWSYLQTEKSVQRKSWAYFPALHTHKVERIFIVKLNEAK